MRIGKLAALTGVSCDTLRFYEDRGLLHSVRRANGYRDYPEEAAALVGYIRTAQRLGFSLAEIGQHLPALWHSAEPDQAITTLIEEKIHIIEARIAELAALRDQLRERLHMACPLRTAV